MTSNSANNKVLCVDFIFKVLFCILLIAYRPYVLAAAAQILNDNFFQNPAELAKTHNMQVLIGNMLLLPKFEFKGKSYGREGKAESLTQDSLPYLLIAYRFNDRFVLGFNATPSAYGDLAWSQNSIVSQASTRTKDIYYRFAVQASYQVSPQLSVGMGLNLEDNHLFELNYIVAGLGNQVNKISGVNATADIGLYYQLNNQNYLTAAIYSPVNTLGEGTSKLGTTVNNQFAMTITQAAVAFVGLEHLLSDKWFFSEKLYWSGWDIQKNLVMANSTTGTNITPTNWRNAWSFQYVARFTATDRLGIINFGNYETNLISPQFNQIGYPLSAFGSLGAGFDVVIKEGLSTQIIYGYGAFIPKAKINNFYSQGQVTLNVQSITLQCSYKA